MRTFRLPVIALFAVTLFSTFAYANNGRGRGADPAECGRGPTPDGYAKAITMLADGTLPSFNDYNLVQGDAEAFWQETFGWDANDIADNRQAALDFFMSKFGIPADMVPQGMFFSFMVNPDAQYRVTTASDEVVTDAGWQLTDTGWMFMVTDPAGYDVPGGMNGDFAGVHMTQGSVVVFGQYYMEPRVPRNCRQRGYRPQPIRIAYSAGCPVIPDPAGFITFICDLHHPKWGEGKAIGTTVPKFGPEGYTPTTRNYLTFEN